MGKVYYKCALTRQSNSASTDWKSRWPACGKFERETPEFEKLMFEPMPERIGSILDRYYALGYYGTPYKGKKNTLIWKAYKAGKERREARVDRYGNAGPVMICDGEWWFAGCFIQDQRGMACQGLPAFVVFPDRPNKPPCKTWGYNILTADTLNAAVEIAFKWGLEFYSKGSPTNIL